MKLSLFNKRLAFIMAVMILLFVLDYLFFSHTWNIRHILLGCILGIVLALIALPRRMATDFRLDVSAILQAYSEYFIAIGSQFLGENLQVDIIKIKIQVEEVLSPPFFPEWVYRKGFSDFFRQGHRHFLTRLEQAGQVLFAMHYTSRHSLRGDLLDSFREPLTYCIAQTRLLFSALLTRLELKESAEPLPDFIEDITMLENTFHRIVTLPVELLDMSQEALFLAAFIYDLKDLRKCLLLLAEALRVD